MVLVPFLPSYIYHGPIAIEGHSTIILFYLYLRMKIDTQMQYQGVSPPSRHEIGKTYMLILQAYELLYFLAYEYDKRINSGKLRKIN